MTSSGCSLSKPGAALTLAELTVTHGKAALGGGVLSRGTALTSIGCTFAHNDTSGNGGALNNSQGTATITGTTFLQNDAQLGAAVSNGAGNMYVTNSTFIFNTADEYGGAVMNGGGWTLYLTNSTLAGNSALTGTLTNWTGIIRVKNTIVSGGIGDTCSGWITNDGNNIEDGTTCGWGTTNGSMSSTDPLLGSLVVHGAGPQTISLMWNSPAVDGVTYNAPNGCPEKDQRAVDRPVDGNGDGTAVCDIGAYEAFPAVFLPAAIRDQ